MIESQNQVIADLTARLARFDEKESTSTSSLESLELAQDHDDSNLTAWNEGSPPNSGDSTLSANEDIEEQVLIGDSVNAQITDLSWLVKDAAFEDKVKNGIQNLRQFYYLEGSFDFKSFIDRPYANEIKPNQVWLDNLNTFSVETKEKWDDFVKQMGSIIDCLCMELRKYYRMDSAKITQGELINFTNDFMHKFPLVRTKWLAFKNNCCERKMFQVAKTTFWNVSAGDWFSKKLHRKLYSKDRQPALEKNQVGGHESNPEVPKKSPRSLNTTKNNHENALKRWLDENSSPKTPMAKKRLATFFLENPNIGTNHPFRETMKRMSFDD